MNNEIPNHIEQAQSNRAKKFVKDLGIYSIGTLGGKLISFLLVPFYTYFVKNPADFGYYDLCFNFCMIATPLVSTQLRDGVFRFLLGEDNQKTRENVINFVARQLSVNLFITALISLIIASSWDITYQWQTVLLLMTMAVFEVYAQTVRGLGRNKLYVANGLLATFSIGLFSILLVAILKQGVEGILMANVYGRVLAMLITELRTRLVVSHLKFASIEWSLGKKIIKYSLPLIPTAVGWWLLNSSNRFFLKYYCGLEVTGTFAVASKFSAVIFSLAIIFYQSWQETALLQYHSKTRDHFFSNIFNSYISVLGIVIILYTFVVKWNYSWLVSANYQKSSIYIFTLGCVVSLYAISSFFEIGYQCARETLRLFWSMLLVTIINIALNILLIPAFGIKGTIAASLLSYLILIGYRWIESKKRYFKISPSLSSIVVVAAIGLSQFVYLKSSNLVVDLVFVLMTVMLLIFYSPQPIREKIHAFLHKRKSD